MVKSKRAFKSAKRSKELARLQKREEKRLRRQGKQEAPPETVEDVPRDEAAPGAETESQSGNGSEPSDGR